MIRANRLRRYGSPFLFGGRSHRYGPYFRTKLRPLIAGIAIRLIVLHAKARLPMLGATVQTGARRARVINGRKRAQVLAFGRYFGNRVEYDARVPDDKMFSSEEYFVDEGKRGLGSESVANLHHNVRGRSLSPQRTPRTTRCR